MCADSGRLWLWEVQPADKWHEPEEQHVRDAVWSGVEDGKRQGQSDVPRNESGDEDDRIFQTESQDCSGLFPSVETILDLGAKEDGESLVAGRCRHGRTDDEVRHVAADRMEKEGDATFDFHE